MTIHWRLVSDCAAVGAEWPRGLPSLRRSSASGLGPSCVLWSPSEDGGFAGLPASGFEVVGEFDGVDGAGAGALDLHGPDFEVHDAGGLVFGGAGVSFHQRRCSIQRSGGAVTSQVLPLSHTRRGAPAGVVVTLRFTA